MSESGEPVAWEKLREKVEALAEHDIDGSEWPLTRKGSVALYPSDILEAIHTHPPTVSGEPIRAVAQALQWMYPTEAYKTAEGLFICDAEKLAQILAPDQAVSGEPEAALEAFGKIFNQALHSGCDNCGKMSNEGLKLFVNEARIVRAALASPAPPEGREEALREKLRGVTYESRSGRGARGFMEHHIDAIAAALIPKPVEEEHHDQP